MLSKWHHYMNNNCNLVRKCVRKLDICNSPLRHDSDNVTGMTVPFRHFLSISITNPWLNQTQYTRYHLKANTMLLKMPVPLSLEN